MITRQQVAIEDVQRVAELAHLQLNPEEAQGMSQDLNAILEYVAQLNELDTSAVEPMAQVAEVLQRNSAPASHLRADTVVPSLQRNSVMDSAPASDGVFFKVPKVIER